MNMMALLRADLARQYLYAGQPQRVPSNGAVWRSALSPRFMPVVVFRLSHACYRRGWTVLAKLFSMWNFTVFGLEIAVRCEIGPGLYFPHTQGTVIGALRIGANATIYHNVTFGAREVDIGYQDQSRPSVGNDVIVGAGAKVLGPVMLADGSRVGANAVVVDDVAAGSTVIGIPARPLPPK